MWNNFTSQLSDSLTFKSEIKIDNTAMRYLYLRQTPWHLIPKMYVWSNPVLLKFGKKKTGQKTLLIVKSIGASVVGGLSLWSVTVA